MGELTHGFARAYGAHEILYFNVGEAVFITFNVFLPFSLSPRKRRRPLQLVKTTFSTTSFWCRPCQILPIAFQNAIVLANTLSATTSFGVGHADGARRLPSGKTKLFFPVVQVVYFFPCSSRHHSLRSIHSLKNGSTNLHERRHSYTSSSAASLLTAFLTVAFRYCRASFRSIPQRSAQFLHVSGDRIGGITKFCPIKNIANWDNYGKNGRALAGGESGRIDTRICSRLRRSRNTLFQCRRSRFHYFQCFPPLLPLSQKAPQALSHVPSLSEQIVKRHFRLDVRRILVLCKSICCYISHVYGLARSCFTLEGRLLVPHFGVVFGVERILLRREFHFAKVDYSIAAVD